MSLAPVIFDSFETAPEFAPLRQALQAGDWAAFERAIGTLPTDVAGTALSGLSDVHGIEAILEREVAAHPESAWASTALALRYITIGWAIRTGNLAKNVSNTQFQQFFEWLERAEEILAEVTAQHPDFPHAWSAQLLTARGLQLDVDETRRRYDRYALLSPHDLPAQEQMLQKLLPKWSGSWEQSEAFVRESTMAAPPGSNPFALVAVLHVERWVDLDDDDESEAYFTRPEVVAELRDAAASLLQGDRHIDPTSVKAHTAFAMAFWMGKHFDDAAVHVRLLDGRAHEFPWYFVTESARKLTSINRQILGEKKKWFGR